MSVHDDYNDAIAVNAIRERLMNRLRAEWDEECRDEPFDEDSQRVHELVDAELRKYGPWPALSRWWV